MLRAKSSRRSVDRVRGRATARPSLALRFRGQHGFTLIEMLVVISIIGILAAVVSMSMIGLTNMAQRRAMDGELMELQGAMHFMIADQVVDPDQACSLYSGPPGGTADMSQFPSSLPVQRRASSGQQTDRQPVQLFPIYVHKQTMMRAYVCTGSGAVEPADG